MGSKAKELAKLLSGSGQGGTIAPALVSDQQNTSTGLFALPVGTTAQRPTSSYNGSLRYNTEFNRLEQYTPDGWTAIDTPPTITSLSYAGDDLAADTAGGTVITLTGTNFQDSFSVTVGGTTASTVTYVNGTSVTFEAPAKSSGSYDVQLTNANGLTATLQSGINYSGTPTFSTNAALGSFEANTTIPTITIVATDDDGGAISYTVSSGGLPTGLTLNSDGTITGTTPSVNGQQTSYFTIEATDDENQANTKDFNIIILRPLYAYAVEDSVVFNGAASQRLELTPSSSGSQQRWTWSGWLKKASYGSTEFFVYGGDGGSAAVNVYFNSDGGLGVGIDMGSSYAINNTHWKFRDETAWFHFQLAFDLTNSNDDLLVQVWINGTKIPNNSSNWYVDGWNTLHSGGQWTTVRNASPTFNAANKKMHIGSGNNGANPFSGYVANINFVDGLALDPSYFTETYNDVFQPKEYTGAYGTNGYHLRFLDDGVLGIVDETGKKSLTINGSTAKSSTQAKFGGTSILMGGGGNANAPSGYGIEYSANNLVSPDGSNNITFECWYYNDGATYGTIWHGRQTDWYNPYLYTSTNGSVVWWNQTNGGSNGGSYTATQTLTAGWNHIAVCVSAKTVSFFINGVAAGSNTWASGTWSVTGINMIGAGATVYMDDIRISDVTRYTSSFTPPTEYSSIDADTQLLIQSNYSASANLGTDSSSNGRDWTPVNFTFNRTSKDTPTE